MLLLAFTFSIMLFLPKQSNAQQTGSWVSEVSQDGFILKKVVSDTLIASGQSFSYTIYYTIPAGATNVTISDIIPPALEYQGHTVNSACGTPTVNAPTLNTMGGLFSVSFAIVPNGCVGSLTITVAFPNGITCPNTSVRNRACLTGSMSDKMVDLCTGYINTTAQASNPWGINKYPVGLAWSGGNCPWSVGIDTVTYKVCVYKNVGTTGQLNLVNGFVTDTLPTGAQLISSNCGATQTGNIITWNLGNMSALPQYNTACCNFVIYYPSSQFPNGTTISNTAVLSGSLGPQNQPCSDFTKSASICIKKEDIQNASLSKWVYTNRQPGCSGRYLVYICNSGTSQLTVNAIDTLPTALSNFSVGSVYPSSLSGTINSGVLTINGTLASGQCGYAYVNFTIPSTAMQGDTISNCVTLTSITPNQTACNTFIVESPAPKPCLWKDVCDKDASYTPGSTFRYRLRIQNIGGQDLSGTSLMDTLNPNLEYIGNPSFYTSNTWNIPNCKPNPTSSELWNGVSISYNAGSNVVSAAIPTIGAACQNIFYTNCGMYGTGSVPYYYIEFDVKVRDTSALGNIPNNFTLEGGSLGNNSINSNNVYILVVGDVGYNLEKQIKKPNDNTYGSSVITQPGSNVNYRLKMNSFGTAALGHITFVDLLPMNDTPNDQSILQTCMTRNGQFDVAYLNVLGTPNPNPVFAYSNPSIALASVNNLVPTGAPGNSFSNGCGSSGSWLSGVGSGDKNLGIYFGSTSVGSGGAEYQFAATVDANAKEKEISCNSFAASGWTKHLIQSSIISHQIAGELESQTACIEIGKVEPPSNCLEDYNINVECTGMDPAGNTTYSISINAASCTPAILFVNSPDGSISPATHSLTGSPWTIAFNYVNTSGNNPITIHYNIICNNKECRDSIITDLPPCDGSGSNDKDCCKEVEFNLKDPKFKWNSATGYVGLSMPFTVGPTPIQELKATIVSAQLRRKCGFSTGSWQRIFGDITGGSVVVSPGTGPQLLSYFSREAIWGSDSCVNWTKGANLNLNMKFPPLSGWFLCTDTLVFSIRYSFTDCDCITCDTVAQYKIVRWKKPIIWEDDVIFKPYKPIIDERNGKNNKTLKTNTNRTSLTMEDMSKGIFRIVSPDEPENDIIVHGLELSSDDVGFVSLSSGETDGYIFGSTAFINVEVIPGDNKEISIEFDNSDNLKRFEVYARFLYSMGDDEQIFSDNVTYTALVPGVEQDIIAHESDQVLEDIHTFAIYLQNQNGYDENISAFSIKPSDDQSIIAVGPPIQDDSGILIFPRKQEDNSYFIALSGEGETIIPNETVTPVYLTIAGITEDDIDMEFYTYDESGNVLSEGSFSLGSPLISVEGDGFTPDASTEISVFPNPSGTVASISINTAVSLYAVDIVIRDISGSIVSQPGESVNLNKGVNIINVNMSDHSSGTYFVELIGGNVHESHKFIIKR